MTNSLYLDAFKPSSNWPWVGGEPSWPKIEAGLPKISIVTPSYNQGCYLEETIRSVIMQGYPNLEYIIIDGGSSDNSVEIIKKYSKEISYWVSEPDQGQTAAINKGFDVATGEILAYINSDDIYMPYTLHFVAYIFQRWPDLQWITGRRSHITQGNIICPSTSNRIVFNQELYQKGYHLDWLLGWNQQVSTFWKRSLMNKVGNKLNDSFDCSMDIDLWVKMSKQASLVSVNAILAAMRQHSQQKSRTLRKDFVEIEGRAREYGLPSLGIRKTIAWMMKTPGLRWIIRRVMYDGVGEIIQWNPMTETWERERKLVY